MIIDIDDYIAHYGVNGMHWGIRKKRETSGERDSHQFQGIHLTGKQVKTLVLISLGAAAIATIGVLAIKKPWLAKQAANILETAPGRGVNKVIDIFPDEKLAYAAWNKNQGMLNHGFMADKLANLKDVHYPADHIFYRISSKAESTLTERGINSTYHVVDNAKDHIRYKNLVGQMGIPGLSPMNGQTAKLFSVKVKPGKAIKIASPKTVFDIAQKKHPGATEEQLINLMMDKSLFGRPDVKASLIQQGYHGMVDIADFGSFAEMPISFFKEAIQGTVLEANPFD